MMINPIAVIISDIHFSVQNLELATKSLVAALHKAEEINIPLIIAGDLHDTKAIIRAEVANVLLEVIRAAQIKVYIIVGNHDLINEKGHEHALNYLKPYAKIIDTTTTNFVLEDTLAMIPYQSSIETLQSLLKSDQLKYTKILIMHQGFKGASMGDYVLDKSSIDPELVKDFIVISGHYHRHQTIGTVTYIGSPYTMTFGEANDGPKGFLILNSDGSYTREILNLRRHIILEGNVDEEGPKFSLYDLSNVYKDDIIWVKLRGFRSDLNKIDKSKLGSWLFGHSNFKLDLIPDEPKMMTKELQKEPKMITNESLYDSIIENESDTDDQKSYLKELWREVIKN